MQWLDEIEERLNNARFVQGNVHESNGDAKMFPESGDYRSYVVLGDHPCAEDEVCGVVEVHSSADNDGIARWIEAAYNEDIAKLIAAVRVAEKELRYIAESYSWIDIEFRGQEFRDVAAQALAQLQRGEFGEGTTHERPNA